MSRPLSEKRFNTKYDGYTLYHSRDVKQAVKEAYEEIMIKLPSMPYTQAHVNKVFRNKFGFAISEGEEK